MLKFILLSSLLTASTASFSTTYNGPLIRHFSGGGFVPVAYIANKGCDIYADRVEIVQYFGSGPELGVAAKTVQPVVTQNLSKVIANAAKEPIKSTVAPCDIPSNDIYAYQIKDDGTSTQVTLHAQGGCSTPSQTRSGDASFVLTRLVNHLCQAKVGEQ